MHLIHVGTRSINLDQILYCERQVYKEDWTVKVYFSGHATNTPLVLCQDDAKVLWAYLEAHGKQLMAGAEGDSAG
ncbi:MAG: hypothetical protein U0172_02865 [Nitrospiraceae bacterium]